MTADDVALAARLVVALILVVSGVGKLVAVSHTFPTFRGQGALYAMVAGAIAVSLPVAELVLAALLLFVDAVWPAYLAVIAFAAFTVIVVRRMIKDDRRPCNCFGAAAKKRQLSIGSLVRNAWFLVLAVIGTGAAAMQEPSAVFATLLLAVGFGGVSAVLIAAHVTDAGPRLAGRVVITGDATVARAVAGEGATVVLVGTDTVTLGTLADDVRTLGGRPVLLVGDLADPATGDATRATLAELLTELFPTPVPGHGPVALA